MKTKKPKLYTKDDVRILMFQAIQDTTKRIFADLDKYGMDLKMFKGYKKIKQKYFKDLSIDD